MNPRVLKKIVLSLSCSCSCVCLLSQAQPASLTSYDPGSLLQQQSSMNEDLTLLMQHKSDKNTPFPNVLFSGGFEIQYFHHHSNKKIIPNDDGWSLSTAELVGEARLNSWVNAFADVDYISQPITTGHRELNGKVSIKRDFMSIGNLSSSPLYFTYGKMYAPFGQWSSNMLSPTQPQVIGRILSTNAVLGFQQNHLNLLTFVDTSGNNQNTHGFRLGYANVASPFKASASYVSNIAQSIGMQSNGISAAGEFSGFNGAHLSHRVGGIDLAAGYSLGKWGFKGEYVSATKAFNATDLSMNNQGAKPRGTQLEVNYSWQTGPHPWTVGLRLNRSWDTLALNLPYKSITAVIKTSCWRNSQQALEIGYNYDYKTGNTASGRGAINDIQGDGLKHLNITLQAGFYF